MKNITAIQKYGRLKVCGNQITASDGTNIQLRGMSLYWSQWKDSLWTKPSISEIIPTWNLPIIRAAMGVEFGGYLENPVQEIAKVHRAIQTAIDKGIYIIVDWHDHKAPDHLKQAKTFFTEIAQTYSGHPNIIYEIYNEPLNVFGQTTLSPMLKK